MLRFVASVGFAVTALLLGLAPAADLPKAYGAEELPAPAPEPVAADVSTATGSIARYTVRNGATEKDAVVRIRKGNALFSLRAGQARTFLVAPEEVEAFAFRSLASEDAWQPFEPAADGSSHYAATLAPDDSGKWAVTKSEQLQDAPRTVAATSEVVVPDVTLLNRSSIPSAVVFLRVDGQPRRLARGERLVLRPDAAEPRKNRLPKVEFFTGDAKLDDATTRDGWRTIAWKDWRVVEFEIRERDGRLVWTYDGRPAPSEQLLPDLFFFD